MSERLDVIRAENPDHLAGWGRVARLFFRLYFWLVRW